MDIPPDPDKYLGLTLHYPKNPISSPDTESRCVPSVRQYPLSITKMMRNMNQSSFSPCETDVDDVRFCSNLCIRMYFPDNPGISTFPPSPRM